MTTNDTDVLIEKALWGLTRVYDAPHGGTETGVHAPVHQVVTAVLPIVEAEVRAAKAEALRETADWLDGFEGPGGRTSPYDKAGRDIIRMIRARATEYEAGDNYEQQ